MGQPRIYSTDSKKDGWKAFPGAATKTIKIDMKQRGIRERDIPFTHYVVKGVALCGETEPEGSGFYNDSRNQCDDCREGVRKQTKHDKQLEADCRAGKISVEKAESENVIDYKANAAKDKPESSSVSH